MTILKTPKPPKSLASRFWAQFVWCWLMGLAVASPLLISLIAYCYLDWSARPIPWTSHDLAIVALAIIVGLFWGLVTGPEMDACERRARLRKHQ